MTAFIKQSIQLSGARPRITIFLSFLLLAAIVIFPVLTPAPAYAQDNPVDILASDDGAAVMFNNHILFRIYTGAGSASTTGRAQKVTGIIKDLAKDPFFHVDSISTRETRDGTDVVSGNRIIVSVTSEDARQARSSTGIMASEYASTLRNALESTKKSRNVPNLLVGATLILVATGAIIILVYALWAGATSLSKKIIERRKSDELALKIQKAELFSAQATTQAMLTLTRIAHIGLTIILVGLYLILVLNFFPWTRDFAQNLLENVTHPLNSFASGCIHFFPNLFVITIICLLAFLVIKFTHFFFTALEQEKIEISGFYTDWAKPTYKIARFLIIAFALVIVFPYLPGWDSPAFKQVGLFLGILVSLGSTGAVAHAVAGVVLTYTRAFKTGDTIRIEEHTGTVIEETLFVTRIKTPKNEIISIPNSKVLGGTIINYSTRANAGGVAISVSVSIGYDQPWQQVHELLLDAAGECSLVLADPGPRVLQKSLDDYSVTYEVQAYIKEPDKMPAIHSELYQLIQSKFNQAGVEIMSPRYSSLRDGNQTTIPEQFLPEGYKAPSFRVSS